MQPLHSYTTINISNSSKNNGFEYLHAELCGTNYSSSISHTKKISELLDKINTVIANNIAAESVCCESIDITYFDSFDLTTNKLLLQKDLLVIQTYYAPKVKKLIPYTNQSRAPPTIV